MHVFVKLLQNNFIIKNRSIPKDTPMVREAGVEPAPPHRLAWRGALPQHILSYSDIRKGVRPALRCRVRANAFKLGGRENLSDGASGGQPDQ